MVPLWLQAAGGKESKAAPGGCSFGCPWPWQGQTLPKHTCSTSGDAQPYQAVGSASKYPAQDLSPPLQPLPLLAGGIGFAMATLRNPSMKSTSEEQTVVTQPLPLPPGTIAIRQFEIQAEEILPSLPQI